MKGDIEEMLYHQKIELDAQKAPEEFESRLRSALSNRKRRAFSRMAVVAFLMAALTLGYSSDAIAYYGKKLLGYDEVTFGSIRQLNEEGMGQEINKSCAFSDGTEVTIDGIIFDGEELVAFFNVENANKALGVEGLNITLKGLKPMGYHSSSRVGHDIDDHNQVWSVTFDSPAFYEKWMTFEIELNIGGRYEKKSIKFTLDRDKAMKHIVKWNINQAVMIGDVKVTFETISASRLSTVVEGKLEGVDTSSGTPDLSLEFDILANGEKLQPVSGRMHGSDQTINVTRTSDGLPSDTDSLEINNIRLINSRMIGKDVDLTGETRDLQLADDLVVRKVYYEGENTCITVKSKGEPVMGLLIDGKQADSVAPAPEADSSAIGIDKVYKFKGRGENMVLSVKTLDYAEYSDSSIVIPLD